MVLKKRHFDDNNSLHTSVKKPKFTQVSMRIMEKSILGLRNAEEQELHSLERDIEECSKELLNKKKQAGGIKRRNQYYKKMQNKIEEYVEDLAEEEARVGLLEELINKKKHELKKYKKELRKFMDSNDIDRGGRKEEELETLSQKIAEITEEIMTKKKELGAAKISVSCKVKELMLQRSKLLKAMSKRRTDQCAQTKEKQSEGRVAEVDSKEKQRDRRLKEIDSKEKLFEGRAKELESKQEEFEARVKEFKSKEEEFKGQVKDLESFKKHFESQLKGLRSKEKQYEGRMQELESKEIFSWTSEGV